MEFEQHLVFWEPPPTPPAARPKAARKSGAKATGGGAPRAKRPPAPKKAQKQQQQPPRQDSKSNSSASQLAALAPHLQPLGNYFPLSLLQHLSAEQLQDLFQTLQTKPLLLALLELYPPLFRLTYAQYCAVLENYRPKVQHLDEPLFQLAVQLLQRAAFYWNTGYSLHISEIEIENTPQRQILKVALEEATIGFSLQGELCWPLPELQFASIRTNLLACLPTAAPELVAAAQEIMRTPPAQRWGSNQRAELNLFERLITQPGSWVLDVEDFCSKRSDLVEQQTMLRSLEEDQFTCVNLSLPMCPATLFQLGSASRVCFLYCNPTPLSYWAMVTERLRADGGLRTVLFLFEPQLPCAEYPTSRELFDPLPRLRLQLSPPMPPGYQPDYHPDWPEGLFSPVFLHPSYYRSHYMVRLNELSSRYEDLPALGWLEANEQAYTEVLRMLVSLLRGGRSVKFLTGTWREAEHTWANCAQLLGHTSEGQFNPEQMVSLRGDPLSAPLTVREIIQHETGLPGMPASPQLVLVSSDGVTLGNNFAASEVQQTLVSPLRGTVHRHHHLVVYYSMVRPLSREQLYQVIGAAYEHVLVLSTPGQLRMLD